MNTSKQHHIQLPCTLTTKDEAEMMALGGDIAQLLPIGGVVKLYGDLGAGKTTLVRGLLRSLGFEGTVKSPTYTLVEPYEVAERHIYHFDLYRLADPEELEYLGVRDYFRADALCLLEWPDKAANFIPKADLEVHIEYTKTGRSITLKKPT
ncbi:tRNA (adenosine(37)-N6)-threonylcarbamoyltransferase complex ATPase subunit type 1 TsaE [Leucothrix sargassi]|nr:tRNA (adenosine(37)-N6)-threonylcarbamoyltransferase complex ATPase subunit type 1 TsaE [Leucothrix sargassi]